MPYVVCAEEIERRWIAHVPDLPGCFASHPERETAISSIPKAVETYLEWCRRHGLRVSGFSGPMMVSEVVRAWRYEDDYEVNAFFAADRPPLIPDEIARALRFLEWSHADLLASVAGLSPDDLAREIEEGWSIRRILQHVGGAEWWYLDRLGVAFPQAEVPEDAFVRLEKVRAHFRMVLPSLAGDARLAEPDHELWSPRKMLRRALWHERDHTDHILQFRRRLTE